VSATGQQAPGEGGTPNPGANGGVTPPSTAPGQGVTPTPGTPQSPGQGVTPPPETHPGGERSESDSADVQELRQTLKREREQTKAFERELRALQQKEKERSEAEMTELEKAQSRADAAESRVKAMERENLARQVAAESGIPQLWHRLSGDDARTMRADAARFREELGLGQGALDGGVRGGMPQSATPTMDDLIRGGVAR
jgi:hypothetical protein